MTDRRGGNGGDPDAGSVHERGGAPAHAGGASDEPRRPPLDVVADLLHLRMLPGIGDGRIRRLVQRYGSIRSALEAPSAELGPAAAAARGGRKVLDRVDRALASLDRLDAHVLLEGDPAYPARLHHLARVPFVLFLRGRLALLDRPIIAVVGARRCTEHGADAARSLAGDLSRAGLVVASGLARGIDGIAHEAALPGGTIGVMGCGIDVTYPRDHGRLQERIAATGLLVSEFNPGEPPVRENFPRRNRIIAALSTAVLVVEGSRRSGSLITADHALELGRDVFAVPGPIGRPANAGTNRLLKEGATMVIGSADLLSELKLPPPPADQPADGARDEPPPRGISNDGLAIWRELDTEARHPDDLALAAGLSPEATIVALLELELRGLARHVAGHRYVRA